MVNNETDYLIQCADIAAFLAFFMYGTFMWLRMRGSVAVSEKANNLARFLFFAFMVAPGAARIGLSGQVILYLSVLLVLIGGFITCRKKLGL